MFENDDIDFMGMTSDQMDINDVGLESNDLNKVITHYGLTFDQSDINNIGRRLQKIQDDCLLPSKAVND
jgi:CBS-domain-containing membrane protein